MKITTNPDKEYVKEVRQKIKDNQGYCCCSLTRTDDTECMCKSFREQKVSGYCHCNLYYKIIEEGDNN